MVLNIKKSNLDHTCSSSSMYRYLNSRELLFLSTKCISHETPEYKSLIIINNILLLFVDAITLFYCNIVICKHLYDWKKK